MCVAVYKDESGRVVYIDTSAHTPNVSTRGDVEVFAHPHLLEGKMRDIKHLDQDAILEPTWRLKVYRGRVVVDPDATPPGAGDDVAPAKPKAKVQ